MKRFAVFFFPIVIAFFFVSCKSDASAKVEEPPKKETTKPVQAQGIGPTGPSAAVFDPASISQTEKDTARQEIQQLIQKLNGIIKAKDYNAWVTYLAPDYLTTINSREFLENVSKSPALVKQKIVLNSARDYFNHVVVPSRANSRVDDIEFVSKNRVKVYSLDSKENRLLRLYDLEKTGTGWKIIN